MLVSIPTSSTTCFSSTMLRWSFNIGRLVCHFSTTTGSKLPTITNIRTKYRSLAISQAQQAVTDYLHATRSLPFIYADLISKHSTLSLYSLISSVGSFSPLTFSKSIRKHLCYHPIDEFEFFFESIGIDYGDVGMYLRSTRNIFVSNEGEGVFECACVLAGFGFPWNRIGVVYRGNEAAFEMGVKELRDRLEELKGVLGVGNEVVVGICLAFPKVLSEDESVLKDVKKVLVDFGLVSCVEGNVETWYEVCKKMKLFYDLGCEVGKMGKAVGRVFVDFSEEELVRKVEYFCRFGTMKKSVGMLILECPEVLGLDLKSRDVSVVGLLKHLGMTGKELKVVCNIYPYVLGRNNMVNLPHIIRAANLQDWFFNKIRKGKHKLLAGYALTNPGEDVDEKFRAYLKKIESVRTTVHTLGKLDFLHRIGFGENALTIKVINHLHGTESELQERFDSLIHKGIDFSRVCAIVSSTPKILNQKAKTLEQKVDFFCNEMGISLQTFDVFPASLCYDLEIRIKPRCRFHKWLTEKGWCTKNYTIASIVVTSEKNFLYRVRGIHPEALNVWFERFSYKKLIDSCQEDS